MDARFAADTGLAEAAAGKPPNRGGGGLASVRLGPLLAAGCVLLLASVTAAVAIGAASIPFGEVWAIIAARLAALAGYPEAVAGGWSAGRESIVWDVRFPRAILAALVGAGLALVGAVLQSATRNPLADPHLLGISSGAAVGAIAALLHTGLIFGLATVPLFAFVGALAATALVATLAGMARARTADRLVMTGVAVSFLLAAIGNLLIFLGDPRAVHTVVFGSSAASASPNGRS